jgi:[methyl-Co(III) methanol-specific corrinoid protein]:coenzyme M methyltransferase
MTPKEMFIAKLTRGVTPRPVVGSATSIVTTDLMEKVGVYFPAAHLNAEAMANLAVAGHTELGFDNVMPLFSVWHESAALGCEVDWGTPNSMPNSHKPLCENIEMDLKIPNNWLNSPSSAVPLEALKLLKQRFDNQVAVVGKVFGPWTLAYHIYGIQEFLIASLINPEAVKRILRNLIEVTVSFANAQLESGADALTLADHCTRDLCSPETYRDFLMEIHHELHERISCPLILHICGDTSDRIEYIRQTGIECFHFDSKVPARLARELAGNKLALMGGVNNIDIIRNGNQEMIKNDITDKINCEIDIIGPECAVPLDVPYNNLKTLTNCIK